MWASYCVPSPQATDLLCIINEHRGICFWEEFHFAPYNISEKLSFEMSLEATQNRRKFRSGVWRNFS